ncbi:MAG: hypothetical protein ACFBSF_17840 [Leptolyngbyaceae cyanobacterium]
MAWVVTKSKLIDSSNLPDYVKSQQQMSLVPIPEGAGLLPVPSMTVPRPIGARLGAHLCGGR